MLRYRKPLFDWGIQLRAVAKETKVFTAYREFAKIGLNGIERPNFFLSIFDVSEQSNRSQMSQISSPPVSAGEVDWNRLPNVDVFAYVTRDSATDIYIVQNHIGFCWEGRISVAFYMDDFHRNYPRDSYGIPMYLRQTDHIECLGEPREYFSPASNRLDVKGAILRSLPRSAGLLPAVRAYENLIRSGVELSDETIGNAATAAYLDYVKRRSKLSGRTHRASL